MVIFPAIDLYGGKAVRLLRGNYSDVTVYGDDPVAVALNFSALGAAHLHIVDLEGAKSGGTPALETVCRIKERTGLFCEIGGGVRSMETAKKYLHAGVDRVILGTSAVTDRAFLSEAVSAFGEKVAVGADVRNGFVAVKGWTENTALTLKTFAAQMEKAGVKTLICTDISRDGAMRGVNLRMYRELIEDFSFDLIASGGVTTLCDLLSLKELGVSGAIVGKAYYEGAINLREAIEVTK